MSARMPRAVSSPSSASRISRCASAAGPNASCAALRRGEPGDVRLEMAAPAARALARPAVVDDDDVAELHAAAVRAAERPAAGDHAAAEPRAEREHHDVVHPAPDAGAPLADRRCIRVVVEADRQVELAAHVIAQREVGRAAGSRTRRRRRGAGRSATARRIRSHRPRPPAAPLRRPRARERRIPGSPAASRARAGGRLPRPA